MNLFEATLEKHSNAQLVFHHNDLSVSCESKNRILWYKHHTGIRIPTVKSQSKILDMVYPTDDYYVQALVIISIANIFVGEDK